MTRLKVTSRLVRLSNPLLMDWQRKGQLRNVKAIKPIEVHLGRTRIEEVQKEADEPHCEDGASDVREKIIFYLNAPTHPL